MIYVWHYLLTEEEGHCDEVPVKVVDSRDIVLDVSDHLVEDGCLRYIHFPNRSGRGRLNVQNDHQGCHEVYIF